jgi:glycosyltransferase involved in cell wall biosynthesis
VKTIIHLLNSNSYSGAENVVITICQHYANNPNIQMIYCSPAGPIKTQLTNLNITYYPLRKPTIFALRKIIKALKPDIIHAHDFRMTMLASFFKNKNRTIISHLHNNSPWIKYLSIYTLLFKILLKNIDNIVLVSSSILKEYYFAKSILNKTIIIGNPLKHITFINSTIKEIDLLFVGRLTVQKNPFRFVAIIKKISKFIPNIHGVMIGNGPLLTSLIEFISKNNLNDHIKILGFQSNTLDYYSKAKILLIPSSWEGFGLVAFEALSYSIPVIAHPVGGLVDLVDDRCGLLTDNEDRIVEEIIRLLNEPSYYRIKSQFAREKATALENTQNYFEKLGQLYGI